MCESGKRSCVLEYVYGLSSIISVGPITQGLVIGLHPSANKVPMVRQWMVNHQLTFIMKLVCMLTKHQHSACEVHIVIALTKLRSCEPGSSHLSTKAN